MRTRRRIGMLLAMASLLASCENSPSTPDPVTGSFVGRIGTSESFVAIVNDGGEVRAYVCDGKPDREATMSLWFKGTQSSEGFDLPSMSGSARMIATFGAESVSG